MAERVMCPLPFFIAALFLAPPAVVFAVVGGLARLAPPSAVSPSPVESVATTDDDLTVRRLVVPGGWIYFVSVNGHDQGAVFVPTALETPESTPESKPPVRRTH